MTATRSGEAQKTWKFRGFRRISPPDREDRSTQIQSMSGPRISVLESGVNLLIAGHNDRQIAFVVVQIVFATQLSNAEPSIRRQPLCNARPT